MEIKLDMSKAYDRIEWNFLRAILSKMGFSEHIIGLIIKCVTSILYNILSGSHEIGPITPSRGLRQGDPLFPYLFIICAEGLSALIRNYKQVGRIQGCKIARDAPVITHMLFVDDSYLYCKANEPSARTMLELLQCYQEASGQLVNLNKFSIFSALILMQVPGWQLVRYWE